MLAARGIGLRNRFFVIILATLILSALGISFVHAYFFKNQRLILIDRQISEGSNLLLSSKEFNQAVRSPKTLEETISKVLLGARIGKVFVLRDHEGKILSESFNVALLGVTIPTQPEWVTIETAEQYVRVRNLLIPGPSPLIFQVGLVLDRNFINWEIVDRRTQNYISGIVVFLFCASVLLTFFLLAPLRLLISHLKESTARLGDLRDVDSLPKPLLKYEESFWARSDEFSSLVKNVQALIDRINLNYKLTRSWTFQMAHELKTPLAVMRAGLESMQRKQELKPENMKVINNEISQMSGIITQFLDWAEIESIRFQKNLHALKVKTLLNDVVQRLSQISPGRLEIRIEKEFSIIANPGHVEQLFLNLITNALKYSPVSQPVKILLTHQQVRIKDFGSGIPTKVLDRLGEPFNVGDDGREGNGLGLAWVKSVAKLYNWKLEFISSAQGTEAILHFPNEDDTEAS